MKSYMAANPLWSILECLDAYAIALPTNLIELNLTKEPSHVFSQVILLIRKPIRF